MAHLSDVQWRKSSYSTASGTCVEAGLAGDDVVAVRNSNDPDAGVVLFSRAEMRAWLAGVKAGEFDDLG